MSKLLFGATLITILAPSFAAVASTVEDNLVNAKRVGIEVQLPITNSDVDTTFGFTGVFPLIKAVEVDGFSAGPSLGITAVDSEGFTTVEANPALNITRGLTETSVVYANVGYAFPLGNGEERGVNGTLGYLFRPSSERTVLGVSATYFPEQGDVSVGGSIGLTF